MADDDSIRPPLKWLPVNVLKGKAQWQEGSKFDSEKNKAEFRQYEEACDRVKNFYKEQHGPDLAQPPTLARN
jgi:inositol oxygenase